MVNYGFEYDGDLPVEIHGQTIDSDNGSDVTAAIKCHICCRERCIDRGMEGDRANGDQYAKRCVSPQAKPFG